MSNSDTEMVGGHGHPDIERTPDTTGPFTRSGFRAFCQDMSPLWFTWPMNAGIIAIILHQLPYQFPGVQVISTVVFMIEFTLFIVFSVVFILRFLIFRSQAYNEIVNDVPDLTLVACWPISWLTISAFISLNVSQSYWGGYAFTLVGYVCWWVGVAWQLVSLMFVFIVLTRRHNVSNGELPPLILIPAVGVATVATVGGLISGYAYQISARLAVSVIITSFWFVGMGIFMALILYTFLLHQLLTKGFPPSQMTASMFVLVGPMGQSAAALQVLGSAASTDGRFAAYSRGTFLTSSAALPLDTACTLLALLLAGMSTFWLILAFYLMVERAVTRQLSWTPTWNSIVFPTGTFTTAMLMFSIEMNSPFFRVITCILLVFIILVFLINIPFTILGLFKGEIISRDDPRVKQHLEEQKGI